MATPWKEFYELVRACDSSFTVGFESFKVMVGRLERKRSQLLRNRKKEEVDVLFEEPFCGGHTIPESQTTSDDVDLEKERAKTAELTAKLQHLSVRNVNKRIKRRDLKIVESQIQIKEMDKERQSQDKTISKLEEQLCNARSSIHCLRQRDYRSKDKLEATSHETHDLQTQLVDIFIQYTHMIANS